MSARQRLYCNAFQARLSHRLFHAGSSSRELVPVQMSKVVGQVDNANAQQYALSNGALNRAAQTAVERLAGRQPRICQLSFLEVLRVAGKAAQKEGHL